MWALILPTLFLTLESWIVTFASPYILVFSLKVYILNELFLQVILAYRPFLWRVNTHQVSKQLWDGTLYIKNILEKKAVTLSVQSQLICSEMHSTWMLWATGFIYFCILFIYIMLTYCTVQTLGLTSHINLSDIFRGWKETGLSRGNPCRSRENIKTPDVTLGWTQNQDPSATRQQCHPLRQCAAPLYLIWMLG